MGEITCFNDAIYKIWLPRALFLGIPEERFWKLNPRKMKPYEKAHEMRSRYEDFFAWNIGRYTRLAVAACLNSENEYPEIPFSSIAEDNEETHDYALDAARFEQWARVADKDFTESNT